MKAFKRIPLFSLLSSLLLVGCDFGSPTSSSQTQSQDSQSSVSSRPIESSSSLSASISSEKEEPSVSSSSSSSLSSSNEESSVPSSASSSSAAPQESSQQTSSSSSSVSSSSSAAINSSSASSQTSIQSSSSSSQESEPISSSSKEESLSSAESSAISSSSSEISTVESSVEPSSSEESSSETSSSISSSSPLDNFIPYDDYLSTYNHAATVNNRMESATLSSLYNGSFTRIPLNQYGDNIVYANRLEEPDHRVSTLDEFSDVLDYYAFYGINEPFVVQLNEDYPQKDKYAINPAFFNSKLCVSVVGLYHKYLEDEATFCIQMLTNPDANNFKANESSVARACFPYSFPSKVAPRGVDFELFPYLSVNDKGTIDVYNSDQLLYALEFGYLPLPISGSPAEAALNRAKEILRTIINDDMTEFDKIAAIETYIASNVRYDNVSDEHANYTVGEDEIFPDYVASSFRAFFAEGGLFDGQCVCQGFGKTFNILANIEGLTSIKVSTRIGDDSKSISAVDAEYFDGEVTSVTYNSHGYSYVLNKENGKYYICDTTFNTAGAVMINGQRVGINRTFAAMMDYGTWSKVYDEANDHFHTRSDVSLKPFDFSPYMKMGEGLSAHLDSSDDFEALASALKTYLASYNDPTYLTHPQGYLCLNFTLGELEKNLSQTVLDSRLQTAKSKFMAAFYDSGLMYWDFGSNYFNSQLKYMVLFKI